MIITINDDTLGNNLNSLHLIHALMVCAIKMSISVMVIVMLIINQKYGFEINNKY